jgi:NADH-quinone oxidoreductase subunit E
MFKTTAEKRRAAIARPAGKNLCREAGCRPRRALRGGTMQSAANGVLDAHERLLIDQAIKEHDGRPGALLGILETVQSANAHKYLSMESLRYIADETGVPPARIYSVATFFALFNLDPQGDNVICVCRGTACHTRGSRDLLEKVCLDLGLSGHDLNETNEADKVALTTPDRKFTIRTVACFGQCALAPVVEVNHHILSHVNERTLQREVKALIRGGK